MHFVRQLGAIVACAAAWGCAGRMDPPDLSRTCADGAAEGCRADASSSGSDADDDARGPNGPRLFVPYVAGKFRRVYVPNGTRYLNDHTLVRGPDGTWHVYGITHTSQGMPQAEQSFLHATAPALLGPWTEAAMDALVADPALNESVVWAPYVFQPTEARRWVMFYTAGIITPEEPLRVMRRADSEDLTRWVRSEYTRAPADRPPGGRDAFALRVGDTWLLYSVGVRAGGYGQIVVTRNTNLDAPRGWTPEEVVIEDPVPNFGWGNLESPFVVPYEGQYYLFVTRTGPAHTDYVRTNVFRSSNPLRFAWEPIADLRAHAAEIVVDAGRYYITSAGWTGYVGEASRGLSIAPLEWAPAP